MRVRDGKEPNEPLDSELNGLGSLVEMVPLYESQLEVMSTDNDPKSDNYGLPTMYQFNSAASGNRNEKARASFNIHPSRIVLAAEGADDGGIYGVSSLEACFNSLMDIRKIMGAGGEGFYRNAAQRFTFNLEDPMAAQQNLELLESFNENFDEFIQSPFRRAMWTPGMKAESIQSDLINPKEFFFNCLHDISAASKIPATILIGQQTGRLASEEDSTHFLTMVQSRRANFITEMISALY